jgi:hypothetical protein
VDEPGEHCDGSHRQFPGQDFGKSASWAFTCPLTGEYLLVVTANCAIGYYAGEKYTGPQFRKCEVLACLLYRLAMFVTTVHNVIAVTLMCEHNIMCPISLHRCVNTFGAAWA